MKSIKLIAVVCIFLLINGCNRSIDREASAPVTHISTLNQVKLVEDGTPFIASVLEASPEMKNHYPEAYVGYLYDPLDPKYHPMIDSDLDLSEAIWSPMLYTQVVGYFSRLSLKPQAEAAAVVTIRGPVGTAEEKTVTLTHEKEGVYGDIRHQLELIPLGQYELRVELPDGRIFESEAQIPGLPAWEVPDTIQLPLSLDKRAVWFEYSEVHPLPYEPGEGAAMTVFAFNREDDRDIFLLDAKEQFQFEDRSQFLREGSHYSVRTIGHPEYDGKFEIGVNWASSSQFPLRYKAKAWLRLSQLGKELQPRFLPEFGYARAENDPFKYQADSLTLAYSNRDRGYLFRKSNIRISGDQNGMVGKNKSDALGSFGGYTSIYRSLTLILERSWNPDTLDWKR